MKNIKISNSFRGSIKNDEMYISQSARINMNNSSNGFHLMNNSNFFKSNFSYSSYYSDLKKTFSLNIDILKKFIISNNNPINNSDNQVISLLNSILEKHKKKVKIIEKIKEKKSKLLIDNQINSEKKRKNEERRCYLIDKIKENEERINSKEEYMKVLHKKMREVEIYIHKNTVNIKDIDRRKKYQTFSMFDFIETNNELIRQRKDLNKQLEKKEKEKEKNSKEKNNEENKIKNLSERYKQKIKLMTLRLNMLKNTYKKVNKKIKILKIGNLNQIDNEDNKNENELSKIQLDTTNIKNSFMDFSTVLNKNFDESKFEISQIGNNLGNVSNFGIYDISIINYK